MGLEDWERRRLAGETPALPVRRGGSTHSSREFSCPVAPLRRMGTYVGCYNAAFSSTLRCESVPKIVVAIRCANGQRCPSGSGRSVGWLARVVRVHEVVSSNLTAPTIFLHLADGARMFRGTLSHLLQARSYSQSRELACAVAEPFRLYPHAIHERKPKIADGG